MTTDTYNGYPNRTTWCMNLWLNNDEPLYRMTMNAVRKARIGQSASTALETFVRDLKAHTADSFSSMWEDIGELGDVDWAHLGQHWSDEIEEMTS